MTFVLWASATGCGCGRGAVGGALLCVSDTRGSFTKNFPTVSCAATVRSLGSTTDPRISARPVPKLASIPSMSAREARTYPGGVF